MTQNVSNTLQALVDKQEITERIYQYCRGVDRFDRELMLSAYHRDAIDDHGTEMSPEAFVDRSMVRPSHPVIRSHQVGNILIDLHGDAAHVETYFVAYQAFRDERGDVLRARGGRYTDWFTREGGCWRIAHRKVVDDWSNVQVVSERINDPAGRMGSEFPNDPVYVMQREMVAEMTQELAEPLGRREDGA